MKKYDYVIVGGGLFAGTFAYFAKKAGKCMNCVAININIAVAISVLMFTKTFSISG